MGGRFFFSAGAQSFPVFTPPFHTHSCSLTGVRLPFLSAQVPRQISWERADHLVFVLPTDVVGWVMRLMKLEPGCWVFVSSVDCKLPVGLSVRGPVPTNIVWGIPDEHVFENPLTKKAKLADVQAGVKMADRVPRVKYT